MQRYALITYSLRLIPYGCADCIQPVVDDMQCVALMICIRYANDDIPIRGLTIPQSAVPTANVAVCTAEFLYSAPDGEVCYEHSYHIKIIRTFSYLESCSDYLFYLSSFFLSGSSNRENRSCRYRHRQSILPSRHL